MQEGPHPKPSKLFSKYTELPFIWRSLTQPCPCQIRSLQLACILRGTAGVPTHSKAKIFTMNTNFLEALKAFDEINCILPPNRVGVSPWTWPENCLTQTHLWKRRLIDIFVPAPWVTMRKDVYFYDFSIYTFFYEVFVCIIWLVIYFWLSILWHLIWDDTFYDVLGLCIFIIFLNIWSNIFLFVSFLFCFVYLFSTQQFSQYNFSKSVCFLFHVFRQVSSSLMSGCLRSLRHKYPWDRYESISYPHIRVKLLENYLF